MCEVNCNTSVGISENNWGDSLKCNTIWGKLRRSLNISPSLPQMWPRAIPWYSQQFQNVYTNLVSPSCLLHFPSSFHFPELQLFGFQSESVSPFSWARGDQMNARLGYACSPHCPAAAMGMELEWRECLSFSPTALNEVSNLWNVNYFSSQFYPFLSRFMTSKHFA